jgi:hypothetical protein
MLMMLQQIIGLCFNLYIKPFEHHSKYLLEMLNEFTVVLMVYHIICFTPFVPEVAA